MSQLSHTRLIVNPVAGAGKTAKQLPQILALLKQLGLHFEYDVTEAPGQAIELTKSAAEKGYNLVVAVGGDGTINEVGNGIYNSGNIGEITLGIINTGSGGDYIRTIGIPHHYEEACRRLIDPQKRAVDLGVLEYGSGERKAKRVFLNFAGLGFDAEIVRSTTKKFKTLGSKPAYLMGLLTTLLFYKNKDVSLIIDGKSEDRRICTVVMSNGKYGGGGMFLAPNADTTDGFLDVLVIGNLSKLDLIWSLPRIYKGTHLNHPKVTIKKAKEINIRARQPMSLQADGELLGEAPASFYVLPGALNIAV